MPWRERSPVDLRVQFISEYRMGLWSMTELTDQYGISRKTGYKWVERAAARGGPSPSSTVGRQEAPGSGAPPRSGSGLAESIDRV